MSKVHLYTAGKKAVGSLSLPTEYSQEPNEALIAQAVHVYRDHLHPKTAKAKTRGEVDITGKKIYRQKGTGGARHGARSAPIFVGGGKAHGPKGIKRLIELPQKMRRKALSSALSEKTKNGKVIGVEGLSGLKKTKDAQAFIDSIMSGEKLKSEHPSIVLTLSEKSLGVRRVFTNIKGLQMVPYVDLNAYHVVMGGTLLVDASIFDKPKTKSKSEK